MECPISFTKTGEMQFEFNDQIPEFFGRDGVYWNPTDQAIADELHRRARRLVDKVVAEAMENVRKQRRIDENRAKTR